MIAHNMHAIHTDRQIAPHSTTSKTEVRIVEDSSTQLLSNSAMRS